MNWRGVKVISYYPIFNLLVFQILAGVMARGRARNQAWELSSFTSTCPTGAVLHVWVDGAWRTPAADTQI